MNNICIFVLFQPNGIGDYVFFNLKHLQDELNCKIIVISNVKISDADYSKLKPFCENIIVRKNKGRDFGAYKTGIMLHLKEIEKADNLILINDTILGPLGNFKQDFADFTSKKCDFWGILERGHTKPLKSFIGSFFVVFKKQVLQSSAFKRFWRFYFATNIKDLVCQLGEKRLTRFFVKNGFNFDCIISIERTRSFLNTLPLDVLKKMAQKFMNSPQEAKKFKNFEKDGIIDFLTFEDPWKKVPQVLVGEFKIPYIKNYIFTRSFIEKEEFYQLFNENFKMSEVDMVKNYFK